MDNFIYIYSKVRIDDRYSFYDDSYEKISKEKYEEFRKIEKPTLFFNPEKYVEYVAYLNDEWTIIVIKDIKMIKAFDTLHKFLPDHGHINIALEQS